QRMRDYYQTPYLWMADSWDNFRPSRYQKEALFHTQA
ncbi:unnamed protein product, partial [marine sediment metagenome]